MPGEDDARNADHLGLHLEALLLDIDHFRVHSARIATSLALAGSAARLIQATRGNGSRIDQSTRGGDNERH